MPPLQGTAELDTAVAFRMEFGTVAPQGIATAEGALGRQDVVVDVPRK